MNISEMVKSYTSNVRMKARLKKRIKLNNGKVFKKGTVSDILIKRSDGGYHFEAQNNACIVQEDEIEMM